MQEGNLHVSAVERRYANGECATKKPENAHGMNRRGFLKAGVAASLNLAGMHRLLYAQTPSAEDVFLNQ